MRPLSVRSRYWLQVIMWVGIIYTSLPWVRPVCDFLKAKTPFSILINSLMVAVFFGLIVLMHYWRVLQGARVFSYLLVLGVFVGYGFLLVSLKVPEEKIHLIEYGILAFLVFRAAALDYQGIKSYALAFVVSSLAGWVDEVIQHFFPNRYYQNSDVLLNMVGAGLGLLMVFLFQKRYAVTSSL